MIIMQTNKRYWLRGLMIGLLFPIFITFICWLFSYSWNVDLTIVFFQPIVNIFVYLFHTNDVFHDYNNGVIADGITTWIIYTFATYAIIGLMFGWLYGKIKTRNKLSK